MSLKRHKVFNEQKFCFLVMQSFQIKESFAKVGHPRLLSELLSYKLIKFYKYDSGEIRTLIDRSKV